MKLPLSYSNASALLLDWYAACGRTLPWRSSRDPYFIWISEIMLQQTQVKTVIPYFNRFLQRFPTIASLAQASLEDVYHVWEGLGYYRRASQLHKAAQSLYQDHGGVMPADPELIRQLPGIGDYTAGAIASIAFGLPCAAVDGNVLRVISRFGGFSGNIAGAASRREITMEVEAMLRTQVTAAGDLTQALMDLGAMVCTPQNPRCTQCPWSSACSAYDLGCPEAFPVKPTKKEKGYGMVACGLLIYHDCLLICRRPPEGIWANLWTLPMSREFSDEAAAYGDLVQLMAPLQVRPALMPAEQVRHTFTHKIWDLRVYPCEPVSGFELQPTASFGGSEMPGILSDSLWVPLQRLTRYAMPVPMRKLALLKSWR